MKQYLKEHIEKAKVSCVSVCRLVPCSCCSCYPPSLFDTNLDEDITPSDPHNDPLLDIQGPITRACMRQLNLEVRSFLSNSLYEFENRLLPNDYVVLRNQGEDQETQRAWLGGVEDQQGRPSKDGDSNQVDFESILESRSSLH